MDCCCGRAAGSDQQPSKDSPFDKQLLDGFSRILQAGDVMRTSPSAIQRRTVDGLLGILVQFSPEHFGKKRKRGGHCQQVRGSVDPEAFNFTKVAEAEEIAGLAALPPGHPAGDGWTTVLANVSPLATGHVLLIPNCDQVLPQVLTEELVLCGLHLLQQSMRHDFRLVFNSLMGFASVNHFHFHGLYLNYFGLPDNKFPIEKVERSVIAGSTTEGRSAIELLVETQWLCRGFVVTSGCKKGTQGPRPAADIDALAKLTFRLVWELQRRNIPHNVMISPPTERRIKRPTQNLAHEEEAKPSALSPEVYVLPRIPEDKLRDAAGFNAAVCEMSGVIVAHSEEAYSNVTEESLKDIFGNDVTLPESLFDELICKAAWLPA